MQCYHKFYTTVVPNKMYTHTFYINFYSYINTLSRVSLRVPIIYFGIFSFFTFMSLLSSSLKSHIYILYFIIFTPRLFFTFSRFSSNDKINVQQGILAFLLMISQHHPTTYQYCLCKILDYQHQHNQMPYYVS